LTAKTLYESYNLRKLDIQNLRVFRYVAYFLNSLQRLLAHINLRIRKEYISIRLRGKAIFRVLNITTLKEEVYKDVNFNKYKFLRLLDSTNNLLNTKKNLLTKKLIKNPFKNLTKHLNILHKESKDS
jgi:hypothetical protein